MDLFSLLEIYYTYPPTFSFSNNPCLCLQCTHCFSFSLTFTHTHSLSHTQILSLFLTHIHTETLSHVCKPTRNPPRPVTIRCRPVIGVLQWVVAGYLIKVIKSFTNFFFRGQADFARTGARMHHHRVHGEDLVHLVLCSKASGNASDW